MSAVPKPEHHAYLSVNNIEVIYDHVILVLKGVSLSVPEGNIGALAGYTSGGEQQMTALGRALMAHPSMILLDEPSMGLAPQIVEEIFNIVKSLNQKENVSFLLAEQNTNVALRYADYGYILENGRVVMDGAAAELAANEDVKEFYLGISSGARRSFKDVKHYRRRKRWLA